MDIPFQKLHPDAVLPQAAHAGDAGMDIRALEAGELAPGEWTKVGTGLAMALPSNSLCLVLPRSGLAAKHGISLVNTPGLIDEGYRGEICVLLINHGKDSFSWQAGERIAQLLPLSFVPANVKPVEHLPESERGEGGFGSSGTH